MSSLKHTIRCGPRTAERFAMYTRKDSPTAQSSAAKERITADVVIEIDLDKLVPYFGGALRNKSGKAQLARGAIRILTNNRRVEALPPPEWAQTGGAA